MSRTSGRLTARLAEADAPDVVVGYRIKRADPLIRTAYARAYRLANRIFFGLKVTRRRLRLQAVPARGARGRPRRVGRRVLLGRAADQARRGGPHDRRGRRAALPADGRLGDRRQAVVICRAVRDFWRLRLRMWANRARALRRGARRSSATDGPARQLVAAALARPGSDVQRVHEVAEDVEPRVDQLAVVRSTLAARRSAGLALLVVDRAVGLASAGLLEHGRRRRRSGTPARTASASASEGRASTSTVRRRRRATRRAWNVSSARSEMMTRSTVTPSVARAPSTNRSWVSGRSGGEALELHRDRARLPRRRSRSGR